MSLVEQAISRLRRASGDVGAQPTNPVASLSPSDAVRTAGGMAKRLDVDLDALRGAGYLPEETQDRQFADYYRRIKRPLIQKAVAPGTGANAPDPRLIMVTSALPGDGKTFTSVNLALSLARERDISVLLVDADTPKPHISRIFGLGQQRGLLDALTDESLQVESLLVPTNIRGLSLLPAGSPAESAAELLSSNRMRQVMRNLTSHNARRVVLLDSPPLLITAEGRGLVTIAGQIVLVVRAGQTPPQAVHDAVALFGEEHAGGIVLNDATPGPIDRYYGYGKYGTYGDEATTKP